MKDLSRRDFLKLTGATAGVLCLGKSLSVASGGSTASSAAVLVDLTRCIGCRACSRACLRANHLVPSETDIVSAPLSVPEVNVFNQYSMVNPQSGTSRQEGPVTRYVKQQCMHCLEPACASACPVAALYKHELGPVLYRTERCIGCRYCMMACPFDVPKFEWDSGLTPVIGKCQFCAQERLMNGLDPACAEACPTGALKFGKREDILAEAHERISSRPEKYINHVYGEDEAGGTSWLYLSDVPFEQLGFKQNLPTSPLPSYTWEVVSRLPGLVAVLAVLFGLVAKTLQQKESHG